MIDRNYNPYDIFKRDDVQEHLKDIIKKVNPGFRIPINDFVRNSVFSHITGATNLVGVGFAKLLEIGIKHNLKQYTVEQIIYLQNNPQCLVREVTFNLYLSILLLRFTYAIKEKMGVIGNFTKIAWSAIKNRSLGKGLSNYVQDEMERNEAEMWLVLRNPISLLLNVQYLNNNTPDETIDLYLSELIVSGKVKQDIDSLCNYKYKGFLNGSIKEKIDIIFNLFVEHIKSNKSIFQSINEDFINDIQSKKDFLFEELEKQDQYYRNKIKQWTTDYPAEEESQSFSFVIDKVSKLTKIPLSQISLETKLEDLNIDENLRNKLCLLLEVEYNLSIDDYFFSKLETIGEIVSFLNKSDNNQ